MKPIDFPEKYENLMRVAQQALANQQISAGKESISTSLRVERKALRLIACLFFVFTSWTRKRSIEASTLA